MRTGRAWSAPREGESVDLGAIFRLAPGLLELPSALSGIAELRVDDSAAGGDVWSCVLIGLFYLVCYYAATVYFGPSQMADPKNGFFGFNGGDPWDGLAAKVWGPFSILVLLAIINSAIANSNAGANAATRMGFALGRAGILPRRLAAVHPRFKTPYVAVHVQGALGIAIAVVLGFVLSSPLNAFALLGTMVTLIVVVIYILTNLSNLVFYWRERREELNPIWNVLVPVLGVVIFIPVLLASFGIDFAGLGIVSLTAPANAAPWIDLAWLVLGAALYAYLSSRSPAALKETATIFVEA